MKIFFTLIQSDLYWENTQANLKMFNNLLENIPPESEIVILPEMFSTGFTMNVKNLEKPIGKKAFEWLRKKAKELNKIIIGSILFEKNKKLYNRMFWTFPNGTFHYYDKRHLFHQGKEDRVITKGNRKKIVTYKGIKFLLEICYDLRFPVWSKNNYDIKTNTYDYDAIIYIANWPESRKQAYLSLLRARAIENQALVLWVNRIGEDNEGIKHSGDTQSIDMLGNIIKKAKNNQVELVNFSYDFNKLFLYRNQFKVALDWDQFKIF